MMNYAQQLAPPEVVFEAVNWAMGQVKQFDFSDRRISDRETAFLPITIQKLSDDGQPIGETFSAITRDISVGGLGVISNHVVDCQQIVVRFDSEEFCNTPLLLNVHYCNPIGPLFFLGASFCADWS